MSEKPFRDFSRGSIEISGYEDNCYEDNPEDRSGAMIFFDAWKQSSYFQFRIFHPDKDLPIKLTGSGFAQIDRTSTFIPNTDWETGKELDYGEYLTTIAFYLTEPTGQVQVDVPKSFPWDEDSLIKWNPTHIYDIHGCKAELNIISKRNYEIKEILSVKEKKFYALYDRVQKLKLILRSNGLRQAEFAINMATIHGDFDLDKMD